MSLILRHNWTRQPQVPVEIDWDNPLSECLTSFCSIVSGAPLDLVRKNIIVRTADAKVESSAYGKALAIYNSGSRWTLYSSSELASASGGLSFVANGYLATTSLVQKRILRLSGTSFNLVFDFSPSTAHEVRVLENVSGGFNVEDFSQGYTPGRFSYGYSRNKNAKALMSISGKTNTAFSTATVAGGFVGGGITSATIASGVEGTTTPLLGGLHALLLFSRAIDEQKLNALTANPYQLLRPVQRRLWVVGEASVGTDNLTASDLITGSPVIGTPALGQAHAFTAQGISVAAVLGHPTIGEMADNLPVASGVTSTATLGSPVLGQVHVLTAQGITTTALLGTPALSQTNPNAVDLVANGLTVVGTLGSPTLGQVHALTATGITVTATLGNPGDEKRSGSSGAGASTSTKRKKQQKKEPVVINATRETERERIESIAKAFDQPQIIPASVTDEIKPVAPAHAEPSQFVAAPQPALEPLVIRGIQDLFEREMTQARDVASDEAQQVMQSAMLARMLDEDEATALIFIMATA